MNTSTLRGIFPDPKPVPRRNFVKENIRHLKEMQGFVQQEKISSQDQVKVNKFKHVVPKVYSNISSFRKTSSKDNLAKRPMTQVTKNIRIPERRIPKAKSELKPVHRGVQTERPEDVPKLYETGVLKYPSPSVTTNKLTSHKPREQGDTVQNVTKNLQKLDLEGKHNYIKENIKNIKQQKTKREESPDPKLPPPNYQKGILPKYLRERKEDTNPVEFVETPHVNVPGLVLLPDEERKEYLRVARENYAGLIKELNSMPVSNDTLKRRKRKIEIEDELKRLDEVIKIFQKPKVFVKADA